MCMVQVIYNYIEYTDSTSGTFLIPYDDGVLVYSYTTCHLNCLRQKWYIPIYEF